MDLRILVVEDSETTRRIIRAILETREWKDLRRSEKRSSSHKAISEIEARRCDSGFRHARPQRN